MQDLKEKTTATTAAAATAVTGKKAPSAIYGSTALFPGDVTASTNGEQWVWRLLEPHVKVLVDVGVFKEMTFPDNGKTVQHCFEASPALCKDLQKFSKPHVIINNVALGSREGQLTYYAHGETMHYRTILGCKADCACRSTVNVTTLDKYCQDQKIEHIDFIKIDVEGHELDVLKGASAMLHKTTFVQFEYGGTYLDAKIKLADVYAFLQKHGFNHIYLIQPNHLYHAPQPIENYAYSNYLAAKAPPHQILKL